MPEELHQSSLKQTKKIGLIKKQTNQLNNNIDADIRISDHNYTKDPYWQKEVLEVNDVKSFSPNEFTSIELSDTKNVVETIKVINKRKFIKRKLLEPTKKKSEKTKKISVKDVRNNKRECSSQLPLAVEPELKTVKRKVIEAIQPSTDPLKVQVTKKIKSQTRKLVDAGQNFKCGLCPKAFSTFQGLLLHKHVHTPEYINNLKCDTCDFQSTSKAGFIYHRRTHSKVVGIRQWKNHNKAPEIVLPKWFVCVKCGRKFKHSSSLKHHMTDTHNNDNKTFLCNFCGDKFISQYSLQWHMSCHGEVTQYSCEFCEKSFNGYVKLQTHYYLGHQKR